MELKNKVAIVTGASEGIGFGISRALAYEGVNVYMVARTPEKLERARGKIAGEGRIVEIRPADITDFNSMKKIIDEVYDENKRLDIFVNNAGGYAPIRLDAPFSEIQRMIELNFMAPFRVTKYLLEKFGKNEERFNVLSVLSQASLVSDLPDGLGYGTSKKALASALFEFENQLRVEGVKNINLYKIYPATVATDKVMELVREGVLENPMSLESVVDTALDMLKGRTPTKDVFVRYVKGEGIVREHYELDSAQFLHVKSSEREVIDADFRPESLINNTLRAT